MFRRKKKDVDGATPPVDLIPEDLHSELMPIARELARIEESARYSCQSQFELSKSWASGNLWLGVPASLLALLGGGLATVGVPDFYTAACSLGAAAFAGVLTVLSPEKRAGRAKESGHHYEDIQNEARVLLTIYLADLDKEEALARLESLRTHHKETREMADLQSRRAYERASRNIAKGGQSYAIDRSTLTEGQPSA